MKHRIPVLVAMVAFAPSAFAQLPPVLSLTPDRPGYVPGEVVTVGVQGLPNTATILGIDTDPGPIASPWGIVQLGLSPAFLTVAGQTDANGRFDWECVHDCGDPMLGVAFYVQAIQLPAGGGVELSNGKSLVWNDVSGYCEDICGGGGTKPSVLNLEYTGDDCSATSHSQDPDAVTCTGDPAGAPLVHVVASDSSLKRIWFQGDVALGATFDADSASWGATRLKGETVIRVFDVDTSQLLQWVAFHTSCSQPLTLGDQFGSMVLRGVVLE